MKTYKNIITKTFLSFLFLTLITSCDEGGDPDPGMTNTGQFAGDWFINITDSNGDVYDEHVLHSTYNTSANDNTMWIDDHENGYWIKCKITINNDGTFSATNAENLIDGSVVTITNGKIEKNAAVSRGGHTVDKISFRAHFDYDAPGYDMIYEGHKRTGFIEDEY